jgi:predicted  nucleic acid-binding Zn-ribbon protein
MSWTGRVAVGVVAVAAFSFVFPRVGREIRDEYVQRFENKAVFLKIPVRGLQQVVHVLDSGAKLDRGNLNQPVSFKVGDQVRIIDVNFRDDKVRFRFSSVDTTREGSLEFRFPAPTQQAFPQRENFEKSLASSLTEGLSYKELESAKGEFIRGQVKTLVREFAATTNTPDDVVLRTIVEDSPQYQALERESSQIQQKNQVLDRDVSRLGRASREQRARIADMTVELDRLRTQVRELERDENLAARTRQSLEGQLKDAQVKMNELLGSLNLKAASNSELDNRMQSLSAGIESARRERENLTEELAQARADLNEREQANSTLTVDLKKVRDRNQRLSSELRSLTSNKDSIQSQFLQAKRQSDALEMASRLSAGLRLERSFQELEGRPLEIADLYLLSKRVGRFEIETPDHPGQICRIKFLMESPDRVEFQEEERVLFDSLGERFKIEPSWSFAGDRLRAVLMEGEAAREAKPREAVEWSWILEGEISEPERAQLRILFLNSDDQKISLDPHEFYLTPPGLMSYLIRSFSPVSLGSGIFLGLVFAGVAGLFRRRSSSKSFKPSKPSKRRPTRPAPEKPDREYVIKKKL